jgi:hypothetical protein
VSRRSTRLTPRRRRAPEAPTLGSGTVITLRLSCGEDAAVARLAALSGRLDAEVGRSIVAEVDGEPRAALSLVDGTLVSDPFHPAAELGSLLALRHAQLAAAPDLPPAA